MRLIMKAAAAAVAFGILASPTASSTVLAHVHDAMTAIRHEVHSTHFTGGVTNDGTIPARPDLPAWNDVEGSSHYAFENLNGNSPVRWNPCTPIEIVVNLRNAPAGAVADLKAAAHQVSIASGLRLDVLGTTNAAPTENWGEAPVNGAWSPVLVAFGPTGTGPLQTPGASGTTQPVMKPNADGTYVYVSGEVVFNSGQNASFQPGFGRGNYRATLMTHELSHLVGLDHVDDPNQVMYPTIGYAPNLGAGDRAGLRILGSGGCVTEPSA